MKELQVQNALLKIIVQTNDLSVNEQLFTGIRLELYKILKEYFLSNQKFPTQDTLHHHIKAKKLDEDISACYMELDIADDIDKEYALQVLEESRIYRNVDINTQQFEKDIQKGSIKEARNRLVGSLLDDESSQGNIIEKGYIFESVNKRYKDFKRKEDEDEDTKKLKFHIHCLDNNIIADEPMLICFFASPGVGKTQICFNLGYNLTRFEKKDILFISGELKKRQIEIMNDARDALVDSMLIRKGNLSESLRKKYIESLKQQKERKDKFYVVEVEPPFYTTDVISLVQQYKHKFGKYPDAVIGDYLLLMDTLYKYTNDAAKYGRIAFELRHKFVKVYGIPYITSTQESRGGQIRKRDKKERGIESIGESNKIAMHCHIMILLDDFKKSDDIELKNKIKLDCIKNTLGPAGWEENIWDLKEYSYIGDSNLDMVDIPVKTEKKKKVKKEEKEEDYKFADI